MKENDELATELEIFTLHKQEWVKSNLGDFVVIAGTTVAGFFPDYELAFRAGLQQVRRGENFLVKQIWAEEPVYLIY
jgi:hypothetical protein